MSWPEFIFALFGDLPKMQTGPSCLMLPRARSKTSVAQNRRVAKKTRAVKRARALGHG